MDSTEVVSDRLVSRVVDTRRIPLADFKISDEVLARILGTERSRVPVAAFNSSI